MQRTLVLNATYEPIGVIHLHRAVVLVLDGRAETIEASDQQLRSPTIAVAAPLVIRLLNVVRAVRHAGARMSRRGVFVRDQHTCAYCGRQRNDLTLDHVVPRSRGGRSSWDNLVTSCAPCNTRKADRTPAEAGMPLRYQPTAPRGLAAFEVLFHSLHPTWETYLAR